MKSTIASLLSLIFFIGSLHTCVAFSSVQRFAHLGALPTQSMTSTTLNVFGTKKSAKQKAETQAKADEYWAGDWVCADCGYIYQKVWLVQSFFIDPKKLSWFNLWYISFYVLSTIPQTECAGLYFEEQGKGFRCPQCSGPRRRYAKKVGDKVGTTLDGGDAPILLVSVGGMLGTIWFGIWAVNNL